MYQSMFNLRLFITFLLIISEALVLSLMVDASLLSAESFIHLVLGQLGYILRWLIVVFTLFALVIAQNRKKNLIELTSKHSFKVSSIAFVSNILLFFALVLSTYQVYVVQPKSGLLLYSLLWAGLVAAPFVSVFSVTASIL